MSRRCAAIKKDGSHCLAFACKGSNYCLFHEPDTKLFASMRQEKPVDQRKLLEKSLRFLNKSRIKSSGDAKLVLQLLAMLRELDSKPQAESLEQKIDKWKGQT
jgi:hypothetical protein